MFRRPFWFTHWSAATACSSRHRRCSGAESHHTLPRRHQIQRSANAKYIYLTGRTSTASASRSSSQAASGSLNGPKSVDPITNCSIVVAAALLVISHGPPPSQSSIRWPSTTGWMNNSPDSGPPSDTLRPVANRDHPWLFACRTGRQHCGITRRCNFGIENTDSLPEFYGTVCLYAK